MRGHHIPSKLRPGSSFVATVCLRQDTGRRRHYRTVWGTRKPTDLGEKPATLLKASAKRRLVFVSACGGCLPCRNTALSARGAGQPVLKQNQRRAVLTLCSCEKPSEGGQGAATAKGCSRALKQLTEAVRASATGTSVTQGRGRAKNPYTHKPMKSTAVVVGRGLRAHLGHHQLRRRRLGRNRN